MLRTQFLILLIFVDLIISTEVALFPSTGCYSHDVMMSEVARVFENHSTINWIQTKIYTFHSRPINLPDYWNKMIIRPAGNPGNSIRNEGGPLVWEMNVPVDHSRPWDLRGSFLFLDILRMHFQHCGNFVRSNEFKSYLKTKQTDLVVVDHFVQECIVAASSLLNSTSIMFSNWPIADGYIAAINVPANPSYVPKTGTSFSSSHAMSFFERIQNTIFHGCIVMARLIHALFINHYYVKWGYENIDLDNIQAMHLFYAGRSEFLFEVIRPISNRVKHFGCVRCSQRSDFQIAQPRNYISFNSSKLSIVVDMKLNSSALIPNLTSICSQECNARKNETTKSLEVSKEMEDRYVETQIEFPELDLQLLENGPFVLISFGSVAETQFMPSHLLDNFLQTFEALPSITFVWQLNSEPKDLIGNRIVPNNLIMLRWAPIKILLAHRNLFYTVLHGGINTINEILLFGIPMLGIPLQGDQLSNVKRLVELGMADISSIRELHQPGYFLEKLQKFEKNLPIMSRRAQKVSMMISTYRQLNANQQSFWLHWAQRHGKRLYSVDANGNTRKYFAQTLQTSIDYFMVKELVSWTCLIVLIISLIS